jgi:hypothetical protein
MTVPLFAIKSQEVLPRFSGNRRLEVAGEILVPCLRLTAGISPQCRIIEGATSDLNHWKGHDASEILVSLILLADDISLECLTTKAAIRYFVPLKR